ncbi:hypothetical protein CC78DRAFT_177068 [Lojkania enalia]|uniref:Uncharacterized protein n=1 Tax=Lojkania enalia TaxID=147567 RepID=A0A9P4KAR4_9PLEO|nr:hypothetical protein CC78DRAFT_177068 [Didymosphaeria enalia]
MALKPVVLERLALPQLLGWLLATQSSTTPTTLIVCSSREDFLQGLLYALQHQDDQASDTLKQWITPTLHNLFTARHVKLAFCTSVQMLLAYLTAYGGVNTSTDIGEGRQDERLVLVNPLALHASTPSFSAQGLSRTFAAANETALRVKAKLLVVECPGTQREIHHDDDDVGTGGATEDEEERSEVLIEKEDPWEQEVPILNISSRRWGSGSGERAWAGRTIKVKRVVGRWACFDRIDAHLRIGVSIANCS